MDGPLFEPLRNCWRVERAGRAAVIVDACDYYHVIREAMEKARLVKALFAAVTYDGTIRVAEAELMRLVGAVLDCPLPPLFDTLLAEPL